MYYYDSLNSQRYETDELDAKNIDRIAAKVPGNVELDFANAGLLPQDIFKGRSTKKAEKYETYEFIYMTEFDAPDFAEGERVILRFDGVDCLAEYELNGEIIGRSENSFMPFEFDVTDRLKAAGNRLCVRILSALIYTLSQKYNQYLFHGSHSTGGCFIRKPAHSYGWDIFPRLITAGIWKDVTLIVRPVVRIDEIAYNTRGCGDNSEIEFTVSVTAPPEYFLENNKLRIAVRGCCGNSEFSADHCFWRKNAVRFSVKPNDVKLWWPYGYGEPNLYDTVFCLYYGDEILERRQLNVGVRSIKLIRSKSLAEDNPEFVFEINGVKVMAKGSNWVPLDALHSRDAKLKNKAVRFLP